MLGGLGWNHLLSGDQLEWFLRRTKDMKGIPERVDGEKKGSMGRRFQKYQTLTLGGPITLFFSIGNNWHS